jgi:hypothetical protein
MRPRLLWPFLPALVLAEHVGHVLVHRIEEPDAHARAQLLTQTGHAYMGYLQAPLGLCLALVAATLVSRVIAGFRQRPMRAAPSWWWAGLPALAFVLQEPLGEVVHAGVFEWSMLLSPVSLLGATLEFGCGLLCLILVRKLLAAAHNVGRAFAGAASCRPRLVSITAELCCPQIAPPSRLALAHGAGERAPPFFG